MDTMCSEHVILKISTSRLQQLNGTLVCHNALWFISCMAYVYDKSFDCNTHLLYSD